MQAKARNSVFRLAALGALVTAGLAVLNWKGILAEYHHAWLLRDAGYMPEIIEAPEGSPEHAAVLRFLDSRKGKEVLFEAYFSEVSARMRASLALHGDGIDEIRKGIIWENRQGRIQFDLDARRAHHSSSFPFQLAAHPARSRRIHDLLPRLIGEEFAPARYPDLRFKVLRGMDEEISLWGLLQGSDWRPELCCFIRNVAEPAPPPRLAGP